MVDQEDTFYWYNICCALFSSAAFVSNMCGCRYILKTFDVNLCLYRILCLDSIITMVSSFLSAILFSVATFQEENLNDKYFCSMLFYTSQISTLTSPLCYFMISYIKFSKLFLCPIKSFKTIMKQAYIALTLVIIYGLILTSLNTHFGLNIFNIYSVCLSAKEASESNVTLNLITVLVPIALLVIGTISLDFFIFVWLHHRKTRVQQENQSNLQNVSFIHDIPLRASLISTIPFIPILIIYASLGLKNVPPLEKYLIAIIMTKVYDTLQNPLIATCSFKINDENRQRNVDEERERKRQKEVQDALKRRAERKVTA